MKNLQRCAVLVVLGLCLSPSSAWALHCDTLDAPLFTTASSQDVTGASPTTFAIVARKNLGCNPEELTMTMAGLPGGLVNVERLPGQIAAVITVNPVHTPSGTYHVTYTVIDSYGNTTSASLPLRVGLTPNSTPELDPVSDLTVQQGAGPVSFTVGLSDPDKDLVTSQQTLVINGLPAGSRTEFVQVTAQRIAIRVTLEPTVYDRGTYRVHIKGRDRRGGVVIAQMRLEIL